MLTNINKKLLLAIGLGAVVIIVLLALLIFKKDEQNAYNVFDAEFKPDRDTIVIDTSNGPINVNNIFKDGKKYADGLQPTYVIMDGIEFTAGGGGLNTFILTATNDTGDIVVKENILLSKLGVNKDNACVIPVLEYVTNKEKEVNYYRSSFTFCKK